MTYSYACAEGEGTEARPGKSIAETEKQFWNFMELRATIAHEEDTNERDDETRTYLKTPDQDCLINRLSRYSQPTAN